MIFSGLIIIGFFNFSKFLHYGSPILCPLPIVHFHKKYKAISQFTLAPNGLRKWGCRMRIRDLFSKIRDLFSKIRDYETKKTAGAAEPPEPPSLAPMQM